jgi:tRNA dimethylallyltransferase
MNKPKIIVVCGPTATGKTSYAIKLAKKIKGEVISADSRQVYKGIDLMSGKVTKAEMGKIPHYLIDVISPKKQFSVVDFQKLGKKIIEEIIERKKTPIICGGTGLYIDALVYNTILPDVKPNKELRVKLKDKNADQLFKMLLKLDSNRAKNIDAKNPVRLVRAIEIAKELGKVPEATKNSDYDIEWIYLDFPDDVLKKRINKRLIERIEHGMLREAKKLHDNGVSYKKMETFGLECRTCAKYLQKKISKNELIAELNNDIWHYVKRQRTWFKKFAK